VVARGILAGGLSEAGLPDEADITIDQFSHPVDNDTLNDHNIAKYQQVSLCVDPNSVCQLMHIKLSSVC
jgi:hypothetical protein